MGRKDQDQAPAPGYITHNGRTYYEGPPLGSSSAQPGQPTNKRDELPPAYQYPSESRNPDWNGNGNGGGYGDPNPGAYGNPNGNAYAYRNGQAYDSRGNVVVVERRSGAAPFVAGAAVGCCLACCTVM